MLTTSDVVTRYGPMRIIDGDVWVSRALRELGEYSEHEVNTLRIMAGILQKNGPINAIDAGAYIGDITVPLSRCVGHVFAFEPQADVREILDYNLKVNDCTNVTVYPYGLGNVNIEVAYETDLQSPGSTMLSGEGNSTCEVRTLDSLGMPRIDLIKADVEGMEVLLLAGAQELIARDSPVLFLERDTVMTPGLPSLKESLEKHLGYMAFDMNFPIWQPDNFNHAPNTFGATVSYMTLAVPRSFRVDA